MPSTVRTASLDVAIRGCRARKRIQRDALAYRRSTATLVPATERQDSAQAALHANRRTQALPAPPIALKRCTWHAGHNTGGDDARTARERGAKPARRKPHSPRIGGCADSASQLEKPNGD